MTLDEIKTRYVQLVPSVNHAAEVCQSCPNPPREVSASVQDLVARFEEGRQWIQHSVDEKAIQRCIDELEEKSDGAWRACEAWNASNRELRNAISTAHQQIAELKRQIH